MIWSQQSSVKWNTAVTGTYMYPSTLRVFSVYVHGHCTQSFKRWRFKIHRASFRKYSEAERSTKLFVDILNGWGLVHFLELSSNWVLWSLAKEFRPSKVALQKSKPLLIHRTSFVLLWRQLNKWPTVSSVSSVLYAVHVYMQRSNITGKPWVFHTSGK